jgi:glycosyltransferase involved in cell wall biosynthesis
MKIAYIGVKGLPSQAGADRVVEALVRRLSARHDVTVYCSRFVVPPDATFSSVELVRVPVVRGKHAHAASLFLLSALHALCRRDFDLIHLHNAEASFVLPLLKLKYKVVATSHGQAYTRDKWGKIAKLLMRMADWPYIRLADGVTSVSKPLAEYYTDRYKRVVQYIPNGIGQEDTDIDLRRAQSLLSSYGVEPGGYILFAAGRIIPTKGAEHLLEAYRALATELNLLVVGDTSQVPAYERMLHELADARVVFVPPVNKALLLDLARLARFFVFPSTVEAMSMMLLEAASTGVPIISSDIPGNVAVLPQQALFFKNGDAGELRDKMEWALQHPDQMQELGAGARGWVVENFQWDSIVKQYEQLYLNLAGQASTPSHEGA